MPDWGSILQGWSDVDCEYGGEIVWWDGRVFQASEEKQPLAGCFTKVVHLFGPFQVGLDIDSQDLQTYDLFYFFTMFLQNICLQRRGIFASHQE